VLYVEGQWREKTPRIDVAVPGFAATDHARADAPIGLQRVGAAKVHIGQE
jgi:hypothetical protein